MNTSPINAKVLDPKSQETIDIVNNQLLAIQADITSSTKALSSIKTDCVNAIRDREYQQKALDTLMLKINGLQDKIKELDSSIETKTTELSDLENSIKAQTIEFGKQTDDFNSKKLIHDIKESELSEREQAVSNRESEVKKQESLLEEKHNSIQAFKETL